MSMDLTMEPTSAQRAGFVHAAASGDEEAFRRLIEPLLPVALRSATVILGSEADAADSVQDAMLTAWLQLPKLREPGAFPAWFRKIVIRATLAKARSRRDVVELDVSFPAPAGEIDRSLEKRNLERAFRSLELGDRSSLTLRYFWRSSTAESSEVLGIPEGTVKSRTHHALERLRAAYEAEERR